VVSGPPRSVLAVEGDVDIASCPGIDDAVSEATAGHLESLTLDLAEVRFMASSGLATLLRAQRETEEAGARFVLARPSRAVRDLLAMTHLTDRFEVVEDPGAG
jgi:anti-sigma B factor antagonist